MNAETAAALEGSIEKWRKIVAGDGEDRGGDNCPLCVLYNNPDTALSEECDGCPVYAASGERGCLGTPWQDWTKHHHAMHDRPVVDGRWHLGMWRGCPDCLRLARAELAFLEGLRVDAPAESGED